MGLLGRWIEDWREWGGGRKREDTKPPERTRGEGGRRGKGFDTRSRKGKPIDKKTGVVVRASNKNNLLPVG